MNVSFRKKNLRAVSKSRNFVAMIVITEVSLGVKGYSRNSDDASCPEESIDGI